MFLECFHFETPNSNTKILQISIKIRSAVVNNARDSGLVGSPRSIKFLTITQCCSFSSLIYTET